MKKIVCLLYLIVFSSCSLSKIGNCAIVHDFIEWIDEDCEEERRLEAPLID